MPETAAAPPTPPIPLAALLGREELGLRQIAGPTDAGTVVHWVHTSEMEDPYPYLLGGELLLSAGVLLKDPDRYASRIVQAGAAALGFGVAPVYDTVPGALIEACDRHGLPLLEVPPKTTFTAVARAVWRLMAQARHRELRRVTQAQQGLATAAARPDPIPAVLHQLAARLGGLAVLLDASGVELSASGRAPGAEARAALVRLARVVNPRPGGGEEVPHPGETHRPAPASATDTVRGTHLAAYPLGGSQGLVLGLATPHREPGDHTVAGVAVVLLSLLTAPHQGAGSTGRNAALVRLLLGAGPAEAAPMLGAERWVVVHARGDRAAAPFAASALGAALGSALVDACEDGTVRILLPADREVTPQPGWTLGVSAPVRPEELPAADTQAARAVHRAAATRTDLVRHRGTSLAALLTPEEAAGHARLRLAPLTDSPALVETLRNWLSLHGSWDRTATAMEIHRNTVRQRIARCATLLDEDLDDADVRMELWFALRSL
ncbi:PucR family transcriptional regulator [Streptomyces lunaelactis]|uniref:PucR family transcriptional regulator n=1 Tax=Streptomyces lunaelactis TaxID=1535768 RepID=UPI00158586B3|nr:PucR family transcriptional regulator [Streptomyces lunaelactis]NUK09451.1 PucR family transcriptional regulator [Streptomyces lunaelactis]NUK51424.1 PucR family transcriptional regulator [Streptomyces lunaelactis]NUK65477.1 PucR family transcriptional regulator [Streptomyces lunaelactis]NUK81698.1 PucR family transcriptional regulator [Streptomyces lunaelactis]NUL10847.1 PucR family transcriptional regulator [Streptomyces lunaelactis]